MARDFNGSNQYLQYNGVPGLPMTMACWFQSDSATAVQSAMSVGGGSGHFHVMYLRGDLTGDPLWAVSNDTVVGAAAQTTSGYTTGTWHHGCAIFASTTDRRIFIDGGSKGTNTTSVNPTVTRLRLATLAHVGLTQYLNGKLAEAAIWTAALSDDDVAQLAKAVSPLQVRPDALWAYWPIIGRYNPEIDIVAGRNATLTNNPQVFPHPRVLYSPSMHAS